MRLHILIILNKTVVVMGRRNYFELLISLPLGTYTEVGLLNHVVILFLSLWGMPIFFYSDCINWLPSAVRKTFFPPCSHWISLSLPLFPQFFLSLFYMSFIKLDSFTGALICIFFMVYDADHWTLLIDQCVSSFEEVLFMSFACFLIFLMFCWYWF